MNQTSCRAGEPKMGGIMPGFTCCPVCVIDGRPQEPYRALPGQFSRVLCLDCERSSNVCLPAMSDYARQLPQGMRDLVVSLISWQNLDGVEAVVPYRFKTVRNNADNFKGEADGLLAIGRRDNFDVVAGESRKTTLVFAIDENHCNDAIEICFRSPEEQGFNKPADLTESEIESQFAEKLGACNLPAHRAAAVKKLLEFGFRITHVDVDSSLAHIYFNVEKSEVSANLNWVNI